LSRKGAIFAGILIPLVDLGAFFFGPGLGCFVISCTSKTNYAMVHACFPKILGKFSEILLHMCNKVITLANVQSVAHQNDP
jgi:hypothetical protein